MRRWRRSVLSIAAASLILYGCSQSPQAREARYLSRGETEFQRRNYSVAVLYYKNAGQAQPRDAEPYYRLGLAYMKLNALNLAAASFHKACELNPKHSQAKLKLAEIMSLSRNKEMLQEAQKRTQEVLTLLPDNTDALNILAFTELRLGKPESAETHLEQALRTSPSDLRSSLALAQTRLARKDVAGAENALKQAVAQSPNSPEARVSLGGFYFALGRTAEAEQQYRGALAIDPKSGPALVALGALQVRAGQAAQAEQTYRAVSSLPDKQYKPIHALFLLQSGKGDQAVVELEKLVKADPADRNLRTNLVRAFIALKRIGDAEKVLTAVLKKNGLDTDARLQRSRIYLASEKYSEAEGDLNEVLHFHSNSPEAHYLLSKVHLGRGEVASQQQELGEALRLDPGLVGVRLELAQALIANHGAASALKLLDEAPQGQKSLVAIAVARNWALLALGQPAEARKGIDKVLATAKVPEAELQDAAMKLVQKNFSGARASAEEVLKQRPENVPALDVMVQSYAAQNHMSIGLEKAREEASQHPASAAVQQYMGQLLYRSGDRAGSRKAFETALAAKPGLVSAELALAELDMIENKRDDARKRLTAVVAAHPGYVPGHMLLARLEMSEGKTAAAIEQYRKAVTLDDKNPMALNGLAYLLAETKQPDEALKYAQQAKELAPENAAVADTLGWTYFQKGLYGMAVTNLEDAIARQDTAVRQYHLAMAYLKAGDTKRGREVLDAALKKDPTLPEAQMARQAFGVVAK